MSKYIKCSNCGKKIRFGELICMDEHDDEDVFCSSECLVNAYGGMFTLTEDQANYWGFKVYDDNARKREIEREIEKLTKELETIKAQT